MNSRRICNNIYINTEFSFFNKFFITFKSGFNFVCSIILNIFISIASLAFYKIKDNKTFLRRYQKSINCVCPITCWKNWVSDVYKTINLSMLIEKIF